MTQTTREIVEVRNLETAEELFHELSPVTGSMWHQGGLDYQDPHKWIFRGQANHGTIWDLTPKAFRAGELEKWVPYPVNERPMDAARHRRYELRAVLEFAGQVDHEGLLVPGDDPEFRDERIKPDEDQLVIDSEFPPARLGAMFALAQHHGIPTRLLDWTWEANVAVYFAAEKVAKRRADPLQNEAPFSVFALRRAIAGAAYDLEPRIHLLTVPTATDANLHAQGGLFSLVQPCDSDESASERTEAEPKSRTDERDPGLPAGRRE